MILFKIEIQVKNQMKIKLNDRELSNLSTALIQKYDYEKENELL